MAMSAKREKIGTMAAVHKKPDRFFEHLLHYLRLTRTYTWVDVAATGILGYFISNPKQDWFVALTQIVPLCISLWMVLNWVSEYKQRDEGRIPPPLWLIALPLTLSIAIIVAMNISAVGLWFIYLALVWIYPYKKTQRKLAAICYLIRGFHTASMFLLVVSLSGSLNTHSLQIALGLFFLQASRSLVAEVRDAPFDKLGLPAEITRLASQHKSYVLCLFSATCLGVASIGFLGIDIVVVLVAMVGIAWIYIDHSRDHLPVASYHIHHWLITASAISKALVGIPPTIWSMPVLGLLSFVIGVIEYPQVFRPINRLVAERTRRSKTSSELALSQTCKQSKFLKPSKGLCRGLYLTGD